jgi:hypothetical protein
MKLVHLCLVFFLQSFGLLPVCVILFLILDGQFVQQRFTFVRRPADLLQTLNLRVPLLLRRVELGCGLLIGPLALLETA